MSGVKINGLENLDKVFAGWLTAVKQEAEAVAIDLGKRVFEKILYESPQYSGDFAANWNVSVDAPDTSFKELPRVLREPVGRGDEYAINYAKTHATWPSLSLGKTLVISNSAYHDEPYALKIETGEIEFRPINEGAEHVAARSVQFVANRYGHIGKRQLAALRKIGV